MRRKTAWCLIGLLFLGVSSVLGGCAASTGYSRFYALSSPSDKDMAALSTVRIENLSIGVGPVEIPDYLNRPQIVTRIGVNELNLAEYDRWAGALDENIAMVVREDLSLLLGTDRVFDYPWPPVSLDYKVAIEITRFEKVSADEVALDALWTVSNVQEDKAVYVKMSEIRTKREGGGYAQTVEAMSKSLGNLSREIADGIKAAAGKK